MHRKDTSSIRTRTEEEDVTVEEEADSAKVETIENRHMNIISTIGEYYGKFGHQEEECIKKKCESAFTSRQLTNYATNSDYDDHGG